MKIIKRILILLIILMITQSIFSQRFTSSEDYKECIKKFYNLLYKDSIYNMFFRRLSIDSIKSKKSELTQNLDYENIKQIIANYQLFDDGILFCEYGILTFPNNKKVYFLLSREYPPQIGDIWLNDCSFVDKPDFYLRWKAIIKGQNNEENIFESPDIKSKIVKKVLPNQIIGISPIDNKNWYLVYEPGCKIGYILKNRILLFHDFPKNLKEKILKDGC